MQPIASCLALLLLAGLCPAQAQPEAVLDIQRLNGVASKLPEGGWEVEFHLRGHGLGDADLEAVTALAHIVSLNLRDTQVTSAGLSHLEKLPQLRRLHLERTQVDDAGIRHLANLQELEYLNLYGTQVSDDALVHLAGLHKLRKLFVWQTRVTQAGADKLKKSNPELEVSLGIDLSTIVLPDKKAQAKKKAANLAQLEWLPEGGDKKPPARSYTGSFIRVYFENKRTQPVKLYWISYSGKRTYYADLAPGARREQTSYSRAVWLITDLEEQPLGYFVTDQNTSAAHIPK